MQKIYWTVLACACLILGGIGVVYSANWAMLRPACHMFSGSCERAAVISFDVSAGVLLWGLLVLIALIVEAVRNRPRIQQRRVN